MANPGNVARGLKGAISNPNTSDDTRERVQNRLNEMYERGELDSPEAHAAQVERGHKAAISNTHNSEESKQRSQKALDGMNPNDGDAEYMAENDP